MRSKSIILSILLLVAYTQAYWNHVPIPEYPVGFEFGGNDSKVEIELFVDLLCSACAGHYP